MVMQLLLRRKSNSLQDIEWQDFLDLQSHIDEFKAQQTRNEDNLTPWETIELMSQAISSYSGTYEPLDVVQAMVARVSKKSPCKPNVLLVPALTLLVDSHQRSYARNP